jgi:SAF domain
MTTLLGRVGLLPDSPRRASDDARLPAPIRVRRPMLAIASIAIVIASVVAFVGIYSKANRYSSVISIARPVLQGQRISASDLTESSIAASGNISSISVGQADEVIGKVAAVSLLPGSLLSLADVTNGPTVKAGDAVVGVALKDGQLPATGLIPGDQVMVIETEAPGTPVTGASGPQSTASSATQSSAVGSSGSNGASTGVLVPDATVHDVATPQAASSGSATLLVSLEISATVAAQVSVAAVAGQISLVLLPSSADQVGKG